MDSTLRKVFGSAWTTMLLLAIGLLLATGCQDRLKAERDLLYKQNTELQSELDAKAAALDAAERDRSASAGELARMQAELEAARARAAVAAAQQQPTAPPARANTGFGDIEGVETVVGVGRVTVRVPGDVLFDAGKADLRTAAKRTLAQVASVLRRDYAANAVRVEGYTDTDPIRKSKWRDNQHLSEARAQSVRDYLASLGVNNRIIVQGYGATQPRATKAQSRRVEIVVLQ